MDYRSKISFSMFHGLLGSKAMPVYQSYLETQDAGYRASQLQSPAEKLSNTPAAPNFELSQFVLDVINRAILSPNMIHKANPYATTSLIV